MAEELERDEKARIAAQVEKLGPTGLKAAAELLEKAKAEHNKPIPDEILKAFPVPDVKSISWIHVDSVHGEGKAVAAESKLRKHIEGDGGPLPFSIGFDHVQVWKLLSQKWSTLLTYNPSLTSSLYRHMSQ